MSALPKAKHTDELHAKAKKAGKKSANFALKKSLFLCDVGDYERCRSMLYALGAESVSKKMLAHVNVVLYGGSKPPEKAKQKFPEAEYVKEQALLPLFHQEVQSFPAYLQALVDYGFLLRNGSDEGDPRRELFTLPLEKGSLHKTVLRYLQSSEFVRGFVRAPYHPTTEPDASYLPLEIPAKAGPVTWYYQWQVDAWRRVSAFRGEERFPLELEGSQLLAVAPLLYTESTGVFFFDQPHIDSVNGLFVQAGVDARTGEVTGAALSRVWT